MDIFEELLTLFRGKRYVEFLREVKKVEKCEDMMKKLPFYEGSFDKMIERISTEYIDEIQDLTNES